jgi:hypothetical protein
MAIGIASDKRYAGGNMTGAVNAIEKIKRGLSDHPQVAAVLKRQNEDIEEEIEEEIEIDELKMDDPKLNKIFDKLKKGQTIKLKTSSTINQGKDFVEYIVKSKNTVNKGRVEKVTLVTKGNEKAVKKFLYKRDGKVTFAIGDMGASIDDIKEGTWALPDSPKAKAELKKLMSKPIKLGKEGDDATDLMYSLIGDDELLDDLYVAGKKNPNGDARPVIKKAMKRLGIKEEVELDEAKYKYDGKVVKISKKEFAKVSKDYKNTTKGKERMMILDPKTQASISVPVQFEEVDLGIKEEDEKKPDMRPDSAKEVEMGREDKKKTRIAQLQLQIAKAQETINKLNAQEKPNG